MAARIQLRRTAGWRKPAGAIVVARPTRWGNPFRIGVDGDAARCVAAYRRALLAGELTVTADDVCGDRDRGAVAGPGSVAIRPRNRRKNATKSGAVAAPN